MLVTVERRPRHRIAGDPDHPFTQGFLCTKVAKYLERTYHPDRLLYPQIRVGAKGEGKFRRATWDEALALIAERLNAIARRPTARRRSCRTRTPARWGSCRASRWTGASSIASARRCSTAPSAPAPGRRHAMTVRHAHGDRPGAIRRGEADPALGHEHARRRTRISGRSSARRRTNGATIDLHRSAAHAHGGRVRRAHRHPARHRRRAGARR